MDDEDSDEDEEEQSENNENPVSSRLSVSGCPSLLLYTVRKRRH